MRKRILPSGNNPATNQTGSLHLKRGRQRPTLIKNKHKGSKDHLNVEVFQAIVNNESLFVMSSPKKFLS